MWLTGYAVDLGNFRPKSAGTPGCARKSNSEHQAHIDLKRTCVGRGFDFSIVREILKEMGETPKD